jgi:hypothetical protein
VNIPASIAIINVMNTTADAVVTIAPMIASGWRASVMVLVTRAPYFRLCM